MYRSRPAQGDLGEVDEEDAQEKGFSLEHGFRLLSVYTLSARVKKWIITEVGTTFCHRRLSVSKRPSFLHAI
jgi:hypothetical protein